MSKSFIVAIAICNYSKTTKTLKILPDIQQGRPGTPALHCQGARVKSSTTRAVRVCFVMVFLFPVMIRLFQVTGGNQSIR
jgi:hypothetical protein